MDAEDYEKGQGEMWEHSSGGRSSRSKGELSGVPEFVKGLVKRQRARGHLLSDQRHILCRLC